MDQPFDRSGNTRGTRPSDPPGRRDVASTVRGERSDTQRARDATAAPPLLGRTALHREVSRRIGASAPGARSALLLIGLDAFEDFNDIYGFRIADRALSRLGRRLRQSARADDLVGRHDSDRFAVWMHDASHLVEVAQLARRLGEVVAATPVGRDIAMHLMASVGVAVFPDHGRTLEDLLRAANRALRRAKREGGNAYHLYSPDLPHPPNRLALQAWLDESLAEDAVTLVYQPQFDIDSGAVHGVEALLRVDHPQLGRWPLEAWLSKAEPLPVFERFVRWGLERACLDAVAWSRSAGFRGVTAVNLPGSTLGDARLAAWVGHALETSGLESERLVIEITERSVVGHGTQAAAAMQRLRALGVRVGLDDFGVEHSALSYLARLPVDELKLDRAFVEGVGLHTDADEVARTVIALGDRLGLTVIAEGIETTEQLRFVREAGCRIAQGYLLGRPMPAEQFAAWLRAHQVQADGAV